MTLTTFEHQKCCQESPPTLYDNMMEESRLQSRCNKHHKTGCRRSASLTEQERAMSNAALAQLECPKIAKLSPHASSSSSACSIIYDSSPFQAFCKRANPIPTLLRRRGWRCHGIIAAAAEQFVDE
ncbi:hypothetical protein HJC23_008920 [Cyclotella cryptica]|uniref:Uncharacterized protein n=1 Tax=Cyclotella cryptica TaxID=29204 RepID=A0ABD3Q239_9STRA